MTNMNMKGSLPSESSPVPRFLEKDYFEEQFLLKLIYMSHFAYACKMRYLLNLVLESWEYLCVIVCPWCGVGLLYLSLSVRKF